MKTIEFEYFYDSPVCWQNFIADLRERYPNFDDPVTNVYKDIIDIELSIFNAILIARSYENQNPKNIIEFETEKDYIEFLLRY